MTAFRSRLRGAEALAARFDAAKATASGKG
jgi:hypothetical protein